MNYFRRTLPSLDALVFFEAASRLENFSHAAVELHVSQVAVSKRIRALEAELGICLLARRGRTLTLTPEGQAFAEKNRAGLAFLEDAVTAARRGTRWHREIIQVAANENINFFWLAPLVREFQIAGNEAVVSVVTANNVSDVVRAETDLAIFHGASAPEGWVAHTLFPEIIAPVASSSYWRVLHADPGAEVTLLDYRKEAPEWVNWETLGGGEALTWFERTNRRICSSYIQSISLALESKGVGLGVLPMLSHEIETGALVSATEFTTTGHCYFLATPVGRPISAAIAGLIDALLVAAQRWQTTQ